MGWLFYNSTHLKPNGNVDRKKELDGGFSEGYELIKSVMVGSVYYAAIKRKETGEVFASVILTSSDKRGGYNFGYKSMTEDMGPREARCPVSILKLLTPTDDEYAKVWRQRCWNYHESQNSPLAFKKLPVGAKVIWTVPTEGFTHAQKGERLVLEKRAENGSRPHWVCWEKYFKMNPKLVNVRDLELLESKDEK